MINMEKSTQRNLDKDRAAETPQTLERRHQTQVKPKRKWTFAIGAIIAATLAIGTVIGADINNYLNNGDNLNSQQQQALEADYFSALERGETFIQPVNFLDPKEREQAKAATGLKEEEAEALMKQAEGGLVSLGWITLWDNYAEDGDVVEVSANGLTRTVPILHAPVTIVVPYSVTAAEITITGVRDGGGGITVAAKTSGGNAPLPPLSVGESRTLLLK